MNTGYPSAAMVATASGVEGGTAKRAIEARLLRTMVTTAEAVAIGPRNRPIAGLTKYQTGCVSFSAATTEDDGLRYTSQGFV